MYRNFRTNKINVENLPRKDEVESFLKSILCKNVIYNKDAPWINDLIVNYCKGAKQNVYSIDLKTLNTVIIKSTQVKHQVEILSSDFGTKNLTTIEKVLLLCYKIPMKGKLIFLIGYH